MFVKGIMLYYGIEKFSDPRYEEDADYFGVFLKDNDVPYAWVAAFKVKQEADFYVEAKTT